MTHRALGLGMVVVGIGISATALVIVGEGVADPARAPEAWAASEQASALGVSPGETQFERAVTPVFHDDFESGGIRGVVGGRWYGAVNRRVVTENPHTGTYSLVGSHPARPDLRDSSDEIRARVFDGAHENWIEWYLWIPRNYAHRAQSQGGVNNKYFLVSGRDDPFEWRTPPGNWTIWLEWERSPEPGAISRTRLKYGVEGTPVFENPLRIRPQGRGPGARAPTADVILEADKATWVHFCVHVKTATNQAAADGAFHLFKNGDTIMTSAHMPLGGIDSTQVLSGLVFGGWANSGYAEQTDFYIDDVSVYASDPGTCVY